MRTVPMRPSSISFLALGNTPRYRSVWITLSVTPASSQAAIIASQSATFVAIGFSTSTCLPCSAAAITWSACA